MHVLPRQYDCAACCARPIQSSMLKHPNTSGAFTCSDHTLSNLHRTKLLLFSLLTSHIIYAMAATQSLYLVTHEGSALGTKAPRVLGVFSTRRLAITAVENLSPRPHETYRNKYGTMDGEIVIAHKSLHPSNNNTVTLNTIYVAIDAAGSSLVESGLCATKDQAWNLCVVFKRKRGGNDDSKWIDEKNWTDANGCRHLKSVYDAGRLRWKLDVFFKHHWYVKGFVVDRRIEGDGRL